VKTGSPDGGFGADAALQFVSFPSTLSLPPITSAPESAAGLADAGARWFDAEVRPHEDALRAHLRRKYPTLADVDDVVQETFLKTFLAWQNGRLTSARGFLFTVAGNVTVSLFRRRKYISGTPVSELPELCVVEEHANVLETVCTRDELALVAAALADLPERCREVAVRRLLRGCDDAAIAEELGISEQTVRVQVARAMKKCSRYFHERGITERNFHECRG
jgi:RNA polymerase sigma-70 factor (ECF subfamily)